MVGLWGGGDCVSGPLGCGYITRENVLGRSNPVSKGVEVAHEVRSAVLVPLPTARGELEQGAQTRQEGVRRPQQVLGVLRKPRRQHGVLVLRNGQWSSESNDLATLMFATSDPMSTPAIFSRDKICCLECSRRRAWLCVRANSALGLCVGVSARTLFR